MVRIVDEKERKQFVNRRYAENKDLIKIGKEINRYKQLDGCNKHEIEKRFANDANKFIERKSDSRLSKDITSDIMRGLRR